MELASCVFHLKQADFMPRVYATEETTVGQVQMRLPGRMQPVGSSLAHHPLPLLKVKDLSGY